MYLHWILCHKNNKKYKIKTKRTTKKHIKITSPNHKFDWTQKQEPKEHKIQNKSTKSKRKAQKPKPKKLKSLNNGMSKSYKVKTERTLRRTRAPNQKSIVCAFGSLCGWLLCVSAPDSEFGRMMSWIGSSPVANNFKRWSIEQLKGACSCYFM